MSLASYNKLTLEEKAVIVNKGTEAPGSGEYNKHFAAGTYACRRCNSSLYLSPDKFEADCGWPSFDDEIQGAVKKSLDADGQRTEITCAHCGGHLGHVFVGENLTSKDTRHCVNSLSLKFVPAKELNLGRAIFAGGCFWGVEYFFKKQTGVLRTTVGYTGGYQDNPTYEQVCSANTGHYEAVEIIYDDNKISYQELIKLFFEIHDPAQVNRQGPDVGEQYASVVFYLDEKQKKTAQDLIDILKDKGYKVSTKLITVTKFWPAEVYHQDYYNKKGGQPYCHVYTRRFD